MSFFLFTQIILGKFYQSLEFEFLGLIFCDIYENRSASSNIEIMKCSLTSKEPLPIVSRLLSNKVS